MIDIRRTGIITALAGGVLLWLGSPGAPRPLGGLSALVALVPLLLLCHPDRLDPPRRVWWAAFGLGLVYYLLADAWLWLHFGWIYPFKAAGSAAVMLLGIRLIRALARGMPLCLAAGLGWAALEWGRAHLPELPCPHHQLCHGIFDHPWLVGSAALWGEVGLNLLLAAFSGAVAAAWLGWREGRPRLRGGLIQLGVMGLALGGSALLSGHCARGVTTRPGPLVGVVQGNQLVTSLTDYGANPETLRRLVDLSLEVGRQGPLDLVVWPESAFPRQFALPFPGDRGVTLTGEPVDGMARLQRNSLDFARWLTARLPLGTGGGFLAGGSRFAPDRREGRVLRYENAAFLFTNKGRPAGVVVKHRLVPGGEYLPLLRQLPWGLGLACEGLFRRLGVPALQAGQGDRTLHLPATGRFSVAICYDNAFERFFTAAVADGATWHLVVSNEGWYGNGAELDQMVAMSVLYAAATRRSILRCTNTGISCLIDPRGRILQVLEEKGCDREIAGALRVEVPLAGGTTLAVSVSGWLGPALLIFSFLTAFLLIPWLRRRPDGRMAGL